MQLCARNQAKTTRHATNDAKILDAFTTSKFHLDEIVWRLQALSNDHFSAQADEIHWGHVCTLNHCARLLRQIIDSAFKD